MTSPVEQRSPHEGGPPWGLAWCLALGQIVSWGILYYAFTVVVGPMQSATGWSRNFLNLGLTLGLLTWGMLAFPAGWWIQRRGARGLMTAASLVGALALALMASSHGPGTYLAAWVLLGAAMAGALYDPAFAVITGAFGPDYRKGITLITLVGGLASTAFIPLAQFAVNHLGWRAALIALAFFQVGIGLPLHWLGIPPFVTMPRTKRAARASWSEGWAAIFADVRDPRFWGLSVWFSFHAAAFTGLMFQLVPLLQARQVPSLTIVMAIALMGPMQVVGRLFLSTRGSGFSSLRVGLFAIGSLVLALLILLLLAPSLLWLGVFAGLFGLGNGLLTIVRGTVVAELFGRERYAEISGALAAPALLAKAVAPLALAGVWSATQTQVSVLFAVLALLVMSCLGLWYVVRLSRKDQADEGHMTVADA